jgi:hypothetical protein
MAGNNNITMRDATGSVVTAGDGNTVTNTATVVKGEVSEITQTMARECLTAIRAVLERLETTEHGKIVRALEDAGEEMAKDHPDKAELGDALNRALTKAREAGQVITELEKPVGTIAAWIGAAAPTVVAGLHALFG